MNDTEQELLRCLQQLFHPQTSSVANTQHQLSHLLERAETWLPLMNIVASSSYPVEVRYFCANMLYSKVRRHLYQLAVEERAQLQSFLEYSISLDLAAAAPDDGSHKVLIDRLILSLVSLSLRCPGPGSTVGTGTGTGAARGGVSRVLDMALQILCESSSFPSPSSCSAPTISPQQPRVALALRILLAIPGELDAADMSNAQREQCERDLQAAASAVSVSGSSVSLYHILEAVCVSSGSGDVSAASASKRTVLAIAAVRAWLPLTGIGLGRLYRTHRALFDYLCRFDSPSYRGDVLKELCQTVQDILEVREYPENQELRLEALSALCDNLSAVHGGCLLQRFFSGGLGAGEGDVSAAVTAAAASALEVDLPSLLLRRRETSARMLQFLLSCCARPPRNLTFLTFDVWTAMQDLFFDCGDAATHALIREAVAGLAATLTGLLTYPVAAAAADEEELEDLAQLRDPRLGVAELLAGCCSVLGGDFFSSCAAMLQRSAALNLPQEQQWCETEVMLFVLSNSITAVKDLLGSQASSAASSAAEELLRAVCGYLLGSLAPILLATQHDIADQIGVRHLAASASRFLGSITFLLVGQRARGSGQGRAGCLADMFPAALEFLVASMRSPMADCRQASVRSFHQLMVHGSASGQVTATLLTALLQTTAANLTDTAFLCTAHPDLLVAVEALTRACVTLTVLPNLEQQQGSILTLAGPLLRAVQGCLACQPDLLPSAVPVLRSSLALLHQILRFGDVSGPADGSGGSSAALLPVLQELWPLLRTMVQQPDSGHGHDHGHWALLRDEGVCRGTFDLLSSLVSVLWLSVRAQADLTQMLQCVSQGICAALKLKLSAASSALKTATVVVESSRGGGADDSAALVADVTAIVHSSFALCHSQHGSPDLRLVLGEDFSCCVEEFFHLVNSCAVFHPDLLLRTGTGTGETVLSDALRIASLCLSLCRERDPLRSLMKALQTLFCPSPSSGAWAGSGEVGAAITYRCCCFGSELVSRLLGLLSEGAVAASLLANIADTLQAIITACCVSPGPPGELLSVCRGWFAEHLPAHWDRLGSPQVGQVADLLVRLGERRDRRLRSMVQDLAKIAAGEIAEDALIAYFDSGG